VLGLLHALVLPALLHALVLPALLHALVLPALLHALVLPALLQPSLTLLRLPQPPSSLTLTVLIHGIH
jgi:hypothetical protein